ncbi:hypothetical protein HPB51_000531 [Rhipicephalus microplus]|uniref:Uncharacterized protein n=1 Tax=Rhipicephalus microplus TaxID=6941 RepID=A0A9J6EJP3_RHIMP|nr:hypothetical protein HPB51_000531 [Rhipicephalus microplus]
MGLQHFRLHRKCSHRGRDLNPRPAGQQPSTLATRPPRQGAFTIFCGGPGCSDVALPEAKRAEATESDEESTSSTVFESASDEDARKDVAGLLISSLLGDQDLGGSEWHAVKAGVAERFRELGKRRAREERTGVNVVSNTILLLSKPLSGGPGVTAAPTSLSKEYRIPLQGRWPACEPQQVQSPGKWRLDAA